MAAQLEIIWTEAGATFEQLEQSRRWGEPQFLALRAAADRLPSDLFGFEDALIEFEDEFTRIGNAAQFTCRCAIAQVNGVRALIDDLWVQDEILFDGGGDSEDIYIAELERDKLGRIAKLIQRVAGDSGGHLIDYQYDEAGRLTQVAVDTEPTERYSYDLNGNRITANGISATYDEQDRLVTLGANSYAYTANGELKTKTTPTGTTTYNYDVLVRGLGSGLSR